MQTAECLWKIKENYKKNKTQTYSKREHFSSSLYHEPQAPARSLAARNNSTPRHTGWGLAGHPWSVRLGSGDNKTRLYTSIRVFRRGLHIGLAQHCPRPAHRSDEFAGERSHGNGSPSSEQVKLLQPLLPRPQEGWWSKAHSRSQTSESCPYRAPFNFFYVKHFELPLCMKCAI